MVSSLERGTKQAFQIMRARADMDSFEEASNLIMSEIRHMERVVKAWNQQALKVRGQTKLKSRCLGKTKKSRTVIMPKYKQKLIPEFFKVPKKKSNRNLCISSDESDTTLGKIQALGDPEDDSVLPGVRQLPAEEPNVPAESPLTTDSELEFVPRDEVSAKKNKLESFFPSETEINDYLGFEGGGC